MSNLEPALMPALYPVQMGNESVEFDMNAFDSAIANKGIRMAHYRALRSPVGMVDMHDIRRPDEDHTAASSGWIYRKAGEVYGFATGNSKRDRLAPEGDIEGSTIRVTFPRFYIDAKPMRLAIFDRFYLIDEVEPVVVPHWQLFRSHETGKDKLTYPVHQVEILFDAQGNEYNDGDFEVDSNGQLVWGARRPLPGTVCSVRYTFRPYWYVHSIEHEIRLAAQTGLDGRKGMMRSPQAVTLQRERIFENEKRDDLSNTPGSLRQAKGSPDGSFGAR